KSTVPADGSKSAALDSPVTVEFDQLMDPLATPSSFSISPSIGGSATVSGTNLTWTHPADFTPNTTYTVTISTLAKSAAGLNMTSPHTFSFTTASVPPMVLETYPQKDQVNVGLLAPVRITFDLPMDPVSTATAVSISPNVPGGSASVNGRNLTWTHIPKYAAGTIYSVTISTAARSVYGDRLASPYKFDFATTTATPTVPKVLDTTPRNGDRDVALDSQVLVQFDTEMEPLTTSSAFVIDPPVAGSSASVQVGTLTWTHSTGFTSGTTYTVTMTTDATSLAGERLPADYQFSFFTAGGPPPVDPARIVFKVMSPKIEVGGSTDVFYDVFDADGKTVVTADNWSASPKDVASVTYKGGHRFEVVGLKPGTLTINLTAKGDTKSVTNSTSVLVVGAGSTDPPEVFPVWAIALASVLAIAGILALLLVLKRRRPKEPTPEFFPAQVRVKEATTASEMAPTPPSSPPARSRPPPPPPPPRRRPVIVQPAQVVCSACGAKYQPGEMKDCEVCGAALSTRPEEVEKADCGHVRAIATGTDRCGECGICLHLKAKKRGARFCPSCKKGREEWA
ncbi:MAG TPA: Ig-like domain-containing protein, partial [Thermoplasmata archaeon]|nr:Ig-like domain-containing protein [Thermoplasmata archaeon]